MDTSDLILVVMDVQPRSRIAWTGETLPAEIPEATVEDLTRAQDWYYGTALPNAIRVGEWARAAGVPRLFVQKTPEAPGLAALSLEPRPDDGFNFGGCDYATTRTEENAFANPEFEALLNMTERKTLLLVGGATGGALGATAKAAHEKGLRCILLRDASYDYSHARWSQSIEQVPYNDITLVEELWENTPAPALTNDSSPENRRPAILADEPGAIDRALPSLASSEEQGLPTLTLVRLLLPVLCAFASLWCAAQVQYRQQMEHRLLREVKLGEATEDFDQIYRERITQELGTDPGYPILQQIFIAAAAVFLVTAFFAMPGHPAVIQGLRILVAMLVCVGFFLPQIPGALDWLAPRARTMLDRRVEERDIPEEAAIPER